MVVQSNNKKSPPIWFCLSYHHSLNVKPEDWTSSMKPLVAEIILKASRSLVDTSNLSLVLKNRCWKFIYLSSLRYIYSIFSSSTMITQTKFLFQKLKKSGKSDKKQGCQIFINTKNMNNYLVSNGLKYYYTEVPFKYHRNNIWPGL